MSKTRILKMVVRIDGRNESKQLNIKLPRNHQGIGQVKLLAVPKDTKIASNAVYFGTKAGSEQGSIFNNDFIQELERIEVKTKSMFFTLQETSNQKHYFAWPKRFGFPSFRLQTANGSFQGGFLAPKVVAVTDRATGKVEDYYLYESIDTNLLGTLYISS